jgi:hypothetical protein
VYESKTIEIQKNELSKLDSWVQSRIAEIILDSATSLEMMASK